MDIAALIAWATTALGGLYLLVTWLIRGGMRQGRTGVTRFPPLLILGHFLFAASGLITWIAYVLTDIRALAWGALAGLVCVALLGFTMFVRWGGETGTDGIAAGLSAAGATEDVTMRPGATARGAKKDAAAANTLREPERPAESHFPIGIVAAHGGFAVSTLILVLLATLGIGS
ncbi:MAG: hypothetical protein ACM3ML_38725 [Micromonosporaceae bacterium]